ncbi:TrkH family potassium uptake protein [Maritimibacter sp. DP1N21-5]|uniref:TrkH family potassium uptake protein n=1 Tax=Maritimibacter sp. DP1N21-5 TaxID=2836867 RepID=UPI001C458093|nr:TrkH family potassium uptake protein [Maritimibacter sp. DP1N21-5]MBV7408696.1 TrkH family potassium uptake protein [Maritimibacter sp. DP1N21-5]
MARPRYTKRLSLARRLSGIPAPLVLALLYGALVIVGSVLLMLPISRTVPLSWSDAIFTATSAVTVTGLAVFDIGADLTGFGQLVLMVLIQLGGLGLMTFAVLVLAALGMPLGLTGETYLREDLNQSSMYQLTKLVKTILKVVLICEGVGALLLAITFVPDFGLGAGLWAAAFHSISAFNNAGFSTFSAGLVPFALDPVVNIVIPALFIVGGIGYVVLQDVFGRRRRHQWTLHTKTMLLGTAILIPWSVAGFAALEWTNPATLGGLDGTGQKLVVSWFQGVTTRTAGFNTTDISGLHDSTSMMFISLMLIGGGPTSTAGGIKVTTFVVMILATVAFFRRQTQLHAFGRSIGLEQVLKVMALTAISLVTVFVGIFVVTMSHDGDFLDISFEVASAFGTVGLSRGYTTELSDLGRAIIIAIMFLGRVGPLTLGFFLATRTTPRLRYPEGQVHLG